VSGNGHFLYGNGQSSLKTLKSQTEQGLFSRITQILMVDPDLYGKFAHLKNFFITFVLNYIMLYQQTQYAHSFF
jgi:hypothetical protein